MTNRAVEASALRDSAHRLQSELAAKIALFIGHAENRATEMSGLTLHQRIAPTSHCSMTYEPSVTVIAQGRKRVELGRNIFIYDASRFLLTSVDLPVVSRVIEASEQTPRLALSLKLEMPVVRELLSREEIQLAEASSDGPGMAIGETTEEFLGACCRLVDLLHTPQDIPFLSGLIQREIMYRILRSAAGARLQAIATLGDQSHRTAKAMAGRPRRNRGYGRFHSAPSLPDAHRDESFAVSEAAPVAGGAGTHAHGWSGRGKCSL